MNKEQAIQKFWESFDLPAYDESNVPDDAVLPYITYRVATDAIGSIVNLSGSIWYRSTRWKEVSDKKEEIAKFIGEFGFTKIKLDNGYIWITQGTPFAQRMSDPDDMIKRIYINLQAEFLTAY